MTRTAQVLEGTWEEIQRQGEHLAGKRLRVHVLENGLGGETGPGDETHPSQPFYATATPAERARAFREWAESHSRETPVLSDDAISRESIYFGERD